MASRTDSSRTAQQRWTTRQLLEWIAGYLGERGIDNPRLTAELLVAHVIDCERLRLYMEVDRPASPEELSRLRSLVKRVAGHEPVQYVTGEAWFYGRPFGVDRSTLIPRPSTESLIERVINIARAEAVQPSQFLDIGTGTGVIAITLASELSSSRIVATDVDDAILDLAARNAARHGVDERVEFRTGPVYEPVEADETFDVICANPPYIPDNEWADLAPNVRGHEPVRALRGGIDGLAVVRPIVEASPAHLRRGGWLFVEIAHASRDAALALVSGVSELEQSDVLKDHEGFWRILVARRS